MVFLFSTSLQWLARYIARAALTSLHRLNLNPNWLAIGSSFLNIGMAFILTNVYNYLGRFIKALKSLAFIFLFFAGETGTGKLVFSPAAHIPTMLRTRLFSGVMIGANCFRKLLYTLIVSSLLNWLLTALKY
jgi:hypothetical protein